MSISSGSIICEVHESIICNFVQFANRNVTVCVKYKENYLEK